MNSIIITKKGSYQSVAEHNLVAVQREGWRKATDEEIKEHYDIIEDSPEEVESSTVDQKIEESIDNVIHDNTNKEKSRPKKGGKSEKVSNIDESENLSIDKESQV